MDYQPFEIEESRQSLERGSASTGSRKWACKWEDRFGVWAPRYRVSRYDEGIPVGDRKGFEHYLICDGVQRTGSGPGSATRGYADCTLTASYSVVPALNATDKRSWDAIGRTIEVGGGYLLPDGEPMLDDNGNRVPINIVKSAGTLTIPCYFISNINRPLGLMRCWGSANSTFFQGCNRDTVLFDHHSLECRWDDTWGKLVDIVTYYFKIEPATYGWQGVWYNGQRVRPYPQMCGYVNPNLLLNGWFPYGPNPE